MTGKIGMHRVTVFAGYPANPKAGYPVMAGYRIWLYNHIFGEFQINVLK
jgi:hypothetical protein